MQKTRESELRDVLATCTRGFAAVVVFSLFINLLMLTAPLPRWYRELVAVHVSRLNDCFY